MAESIREFVVSYAFGVDTTSMARAEAATKAAENRIVAENAAAVAKRVAADQRAQRARIDAIVKANGELSEEDRRFVAQDLKRHQDAEAAKNKAQDESFKRQRERFDEIAKLSRRLVLGVTAVASAAVAAVGAATGGLLTTTDRAATQFERLKYLAESAGASVKGLQAFSYSIAQLGGSAEAAEAQVAEFGKKLQTFPQFEKNLQSMGIATRDAAGHMKDATEIARDFFGVLAQKPRATQDALGEVYGFAPDTIRAGTRPGLGTYMADERARRAAIGADGDLSGERGVAFERSMRRLSDDIASVKMRIETALMALFKPALDTVARWIEEHGKAISTVVVAISKGISDVVSAFVNTGIVKDSMKALSDALEEFAGYISSGDFKKDIKSFVHDLGQLAKAIRWCLEKLGIIQGQAGAPVVPEPKGDHDIDGSVDDALSGGTLGAARRTLGFAATASGDHTHISGAGPVAGLNNNPNATKENADVIRAAAKDIGTTPEDLATVISYESAGTFSPRKWGGRGGNYMGLIQFGPDERKQYGANENQSFAEQMEAVKRYLKDRGFKPGMGLLDLYSTINAGRPGRYGASDGNGTVSSHVTRMQGGSAALARAFLAKGDGGKATPAEAAPAPAAAVPASTMTEAEALKAQAWINSLGVDHPLTAGEKEKMHGLQAQIDAYYASKPQGKMDHQGKWAEPTYLDGRAAKPGPEVRGRARAIGDNDDFPTAVAPDKPVKVEVTDASAAKVGAHVGKALPSWMTKGRDGQPMRTTDFRDPKYAPSPFKSSYPAGQVPRSANPLADLHKTWFDHAERDGKTLVHPGMTPAEAQRKTSMNTVRYGDRTVNHSPTYNVHASDVKAGLDAAKRQGERGAADLVRNIQPMLA